MVQTLEGVQIPFNLFSQQVDTEFFPYKSALRWQKPIYHDPKNNQIQSLLFISYYFVLFDFQMSV